MFILGLTGSIGMGKTTAAAMLRRMRVPVHDADAAVHAALGNGGAAVSAVSQAFPGIALGGVVDRARLARIVFADAGALARLEAILHPIVRAAARAFLRRHALARAPVVVLDIPLLFETHAEPRVDAVVVVTAPPFVQARRVLGRPGMSAARFKAITERQTADAEKRRRADFVVWTGLSKAATHAALRAVLLAVHDRPARAWRPGYW